MRIISQLLFNVKFQMIQYNNNLKLKCVGIGNWASVVAAPLSSSKRSSFVKTNRQLSEETRQQNNLTINSNNHNNFNNNNNNIVPNTSFFLEGVLSFDDEPPLPKNNEIFLIKTSDKSPAGQQNFDSNDSTIRQACAKEGVGGGGITP